MTKTLDDLTSEEWGKLFPIEISEYKLKWIDIFKEEEIQIQKALSGTSGLRIEHFGSTSIPGLPAKDTIDILVEVPSIDLFSPRIIEPMKGIGYHYFLQQGTEPDYMVFGKGYNLEGKKAQTYHVHMSSADHPIWDRLYFRDHLRKNSEVAAEYASLKYALAKEYRARRVDYRLAKTEFVARVTELAKKEATNIKAQQASSADE